jgi:hypothetical protein
MAESNSALCLRLRKDCGQVTASDNCGQSRSVDCGSCRAPSSCGGGGTANVCGQRCAIPYDQDNCLSFVANTRVSQAGRNWTCVDRNCANCATFVSCAPAATGCPWGVVWTDEGPCN